MVTRTCTSRLATLPFQIRIRRQTHASPSRMDPTIRVQARGSTLRTRGCTLQFKQPRHSRTCPSCAREIRLLLSRSGTALRFQVRLLLQGNCSTLSWRISRVERLWVSRSRRTLTAMPIFTCALAHCRTPVHTTTTAQVYPTLRTNRAY
jgi:hypothetical protein